MKIDIIDSFALDDNSLSISEKLNGLNSAFDKKVSPQKGYYDNFSPSVFSNICRWLGIDTPSELLTSGEATDIIKHMYSGTETNSSNTLGLKEIHSWTINPKYYTQNLRQHSGFSAEVIGTAKENLLSRLNNTGIKTFRADDLPDLFSKNDQFVDKVRIDTNTGNVIERIQTKFVGKDGADCLTKLVSQKYDKYFSEGNVDKIEIPKDYYDEIKANNLIGKKLDYYTKQLERTTAEGKVDIAEQIQKRIDKYNKINDMLERSTVSSDEAQYATLHPQRYTAKLFAEDISISGHKVGEQAGIISAVLTAAVTTVDDVKRVMNGEIAPADAFLDVGKETAKAGAIGYGTGFISGAISEAMSYSSHQLIKSISNSGIPGAIISFGVASFDSIVDYAQGVIDGKELASDLTENAVNVGGGFIGATAAGAVLGSIVPGAGTVLGAAVGLVGGMVGCAVASQAYQTAVEFCTENAGPLLEKVQESANDVINTVKETIPEKLETVKLALNEFTAKNNIPVSV